MILQILVNGVKLCYCKSVHRGISLFQLSQNILAAFGALVAEYMNPGPIRQGIQAKRQSSKKAFLTVTFPPLSVTISVITVILILSDVIVEEML